MSELHEVYADVALGCIALAAVFAVPGWLLNRPDGSRRWTWRLLAWLALLGMTLAWFGADARGPWWHWVLDAVLLWIYIRKVQAAWKRLEAYRKVERLLRVYSR